MNCNHKVKWTVRPPEDCRFRLSVSHYKDRIVAPDEYSGATVVTPSDTEQVLATKDKLVRDDITVNPAPAPDLRPLTIDSLTQHGTFLPTGDGFSQVTVEEDWDGSLVPDGNDTGFFHCKVINLLSTDTLVIEGYGTGYRWATCKSGQPTFVYWGQQFGTGSETADYAHVRLWLTPADDTTVVIGGPAWGADGTVYTGNYSFKGDYLRWKVIHAS